MKKSLLLISALALAWLLTSCKKKDDAPLTETTFKASIEKSNGNALKTALDPSNGNVLWNEGDKIRVYNGNEETAVFTLTDGAGTTEGMFATSEAFEMIPPFKVVYPFDASYDGSKATFELPDTQSITDIQSFEKGIFPMIAYSSDNNLSFKNLCGGLGIRLKGLGAHVSSIRLTSKKTDDKLSGIYEITDITAANPELTPANSSSASNSITINCDITLTTAAKCFYIVLPTGTLSEGFTIDVYDGNELLISKETTSNLATVERNTMKCLNEVPINVEMDGNVDLPDNMSCSDIVISNLTETAIPDENGDFVIGYSKILIAKNVENGEIVYLTSCSVDKEIAKGGTTPEYEADAKETAITLALNMLPFGLHQSNDKTFASIKEVIYSLDCVKDLETAVESVVNEYGYLKIEELSDELSVVAQFFENELYQEEKKSSQKNEPINIGTLELRKDGTSKLTYPSISPDHYQGITVDLKSATFKEASNTWDIDLDARSEIGIYVGVDKGVLYDGLGYPCHSHPQYFIPPMNVGKFLGTFTSWNGLKQYFSDTRRLFTDPDFSFADMTWDQSICENINFNINSSEKALVFIGPKDDKAMKIVNAASATIGFVLSMCFSDEAISDFFISLLEDADCVALLYNQINSGLEEFSIFADEIKRRFEDWALEKALLFGVPETALGEILEALSLQYKFVVNAGNIADMGFFWDEFRSFSLTINAEFNQEQNLPPTLSTGLVGNITATSATVVGTVTNIGSYGLTERGICYSNSPNPTVDGNHVVGDGVEAGIYTCNLTNLAPNTTYHARAYAKNFVSMVGYGQDVVFTTKSNGSSDVPEGALKGKFTINANGDQVYFSQGNLQYQASTNTWRFAENQWNYVGSQDVEAGEPGGNVSGSSNHLISSTYSGWIDLFGWGTSGYNHGAVCYQPWSTSEDAKDYYIYGSDTYNLYDETGKADWGYNKINNGGNTENSGWRTLTREEWRWLLVPPFDYNPGINCRPRANELSGMGKIDNVPGLILLPDDWTLPIGLSFTPGVSNWSNVYSYSEWSKMENAGAIFLPAAGSRYISSVEDIGTEGSYWSSFVEDNSFDGTRNYIMAVCFKANCQHFTGYGIYRAAAASVRLVRSTD